MGFAITRFDLVGTGGVKIPAGTTVRVRRHHPRHENDPYTAAVCPATEYWTDEEWLCVTNNDLILCKPENAWSIVMESRRGTVYMSSTPFAEDRMRAKWSELKAEANAVGINGSAWLFRGTEVVDTIGNPFVPGHHPTALAV